MFSTDSTYVKPDMTWTTVVSGELPTITEDTECQDIQFANFEIHPQRAR